MIKVEKNEVLFLINYQSFYSPLSGIILLLGFWIVALRSGSWYNIVWAILITPVLLWVANLFFLGYRLVIDVSQKRLTLHKWNKFRNRTNLFFEFSMSEIEGFHIERGGSSRKRIVLIVKDKNIPFTDTFDNSGKHEKLAKEIIDWLSLRGYEFKLRKD